MVRRLTGLSLLLFSLVGITGAQKATVEAVGVCSLERFNLIQARKQALLEAKRRAVEQACGSRVVSENLVQNFMTVADLIESFSEARVQILQQQEKVMTRRDSASGLLLPFLSVRIWAQVDCAPPRSDSTFGLQVHLSRNEIAHGDTFSLILQAARSCYLSIFDVDEQGMAALIYPLGESEPRPVPTGVPWRVPVTFRGVVPVGKQSATEWLYVIATGRPLAWPAHRWQLQAEETPEGGLLWSSSRHFVEDVVRQLMGLPTTERQTVRLFIRIFR